MPKTISIVLPIFLFLVFIAALSADDAQSPKPCSAPESNQFDFWLGEWNLSWGEGETAGTGTNIITHQLNGCVIEENFSSHGEQPFIGNSVSVYDINDGKWKQTWVDNNGGYLDFTGYFLDGKMTLQRETTKDGKNIWQRMVWYDITEDSLEWNWERSTDDGKTWELLWNIHYVRKQD